ncbi:ABC transporter ATP-binding protein/permease [Flavobacteriaceae bacterium]|nr:ABC transporter ATP-binding protein/permease [Flavobacteriaceae bacterium]
MIFSKYKDISQFLTKKQRIGLFTLSSMIFVGMILEIFGLGILVPIISIMQNPELIENYQYLNIFNNKTDYKSLIQIFLGAIFFLNISRAFYMLFLTYLQSKYITKVTANISNMLFANYLDQSYSFFLHTNTSRLIKNIQVEVNGFNAYLTSYVSLLTEGLMMTAVLITVFVVQPIGALVFFIFVGSVSYLILKLSKGRLTYWAKIRESFDNQLSKLLLEGLGGIKDFKIFNKEDFFKNKFSNLNIKKSNIAAKHLTLSQTPRFLLEVTLIVGILIYITYMYFSKIDSSSVFASLGLFVAASFRLIPSVNKLIVALQSISYHKISIDILTKEFNLKQKINRTKEQPIIFTNRIEIKDLSFKYEAQNELQLDSLNFQISKGQKIGIIGESGSGKSTFIDLFMGLLDPNFGDILVDGNSIYKADKNWKAKIGYVPQSIYLLDDSIANNVALVDNDQEIDIRHLEKVLKDVGLYEFIKSLPEGVFTNVGEKGANLSGGQLQRVGLARAFYRKPEILILDESTSALDPITEKVILDSIYKMDNKLTVIFISHKQSNLDKCDVVFKIENNKIFKI